MAISKNSDISTSLWTVSYTSVPTYKSLIINSDETLIFFSIYQSPAPPPNPVNVWWLSANNGAVNDWQRQ